MVGLQARGAEWWRSYRLTPKPAAGWRLLREPSRCSRVSPSTLRLRFSTEPCSADKTPSAWTVSGPLPLHPLPPPQGRRPYEPSGRRDLRRKGGFQGQARRLGRDWVRALERQGSSSVIVRVRRKYPAVLAPRIRHSGRRAAWPEDPEPSGAREREPVAGSIFKQVAADGLRLRRRWVPGLRCASPGMTKERTSDGDAERPPPTRREDAPRHLPMKSGGERKRPVQSPAPAFRISVFR